MNMINMYSDYNEEKEQKMTKYFEEILNTSVIVKLRVLDPRVNHFMCYGKIDKSQINKIKEHFPEVKETRTILGTKKFVLYGEMGFTIYSVKGVKRQILIKTHDIQYKIKKKRMKKVLY